MKHCLLLLVLCLPLHAADSVKKADDVKMQLSLAQQKGEEQKKKEELELKQLKREEIDALRSLYNVWDLCINVDLTDFTRDRDCAVYHSRNKIQQQAGFVAGGCTDGWICKKLGNDLRRWIGKNRSHHSIEYMTKTVTNYEEQQRKEFEFEVKMRVAERMKKEEASKNNPKESPKTCPGLCIIQ